VGVSPAVMPDAFKSSILLEKITGVFPQPLLQFGCQVTAWGGKRSFAWLILLVASLRAAQAAC